MAAPVLTRVRCLACGGVFYPIQRDGSHYAHTCPDAAQPVISEATVTMRLTDAAAAQFERCPIPEEYFHPPGTEPADLEPALPPAKILFEG